MLRPIVWTGRTLELLDQTRLPSDKVFVSCASYRDVRDAIREMKVRGAPAIGVSAAYGMVLAARELEADVRGAYIESLKAASRDLAQARPTAVNLAWAVERMLDVALGCEDWRDIPAALEEAARAMEMDDVEANRRIGRHGAPLLGDPVTVLTHCNAGALATAGYGTALGVVRAAVEQGKRVRVYADETRPYLQGARLTAFELLEEGIPVTLITDGMAGYVMNLGRVDCVIVGADRIAANGDVANKIGTYSLAVLAKENGIPFYVAAPVSTLDLGCPTGRDIPIEERDPEEVVGILGHRIAPEGVDVFNPAFDVTPAWYISAIITDRGIARPPYDKSLRGLVPRHG
ncbi:MAG: S-methyl-5-thioribose-1-phosphate isomerase [Firmicutes bacterium]|jgi:methylthioribose-1-phosphate isomerase|nr:S-methyl-5-thioribose-1-phosphate isomerase [Bacillota bacterium]MDH7496680.1 S-methyl-5-thioribose-1-phosphate isomerase [Bacillota bacterium]